MLKRNFFSSIILIVVIISVNTVSAQETPMSLRLANSIMANSPTYYRDGSKTWDYVIGTVLYGFEQLYAKTGDETYKNYIQASVDREINSDGNFKSYNEKAYSSDEIREGVAVMFMYNQTGLDSYKVAAAKLRHQIANQPRTSDGGFWHKEGYPYQMWQDGLYMVEPFYAQYSTAFSDSASADFDDIGKQFILMETHARDTITGLIYHGWDEKKVQIWADPETGLSQCFWGRAMGWYGMALLDVLDYFPADHPKRNELIAIFQRLMTALVNYQEPESGCWYQIVDYTTPGYGPNNRNYLEASATCMYVYCLLKGVRLGYLDQSFLSAGKKGYQGILSQFVTESNGNVNLNWICKTAGLGGSSNRMGDFDYYMSEPVVSNDGKGVGPFLLASLEYEAVGQTTGLSELGKASAAVVFPNPAKDRFEITTSNSLETEQIQIFNAFGSLMLHFKKPLNGRVEVNCQSWDTGVYFIHIERRKNSQTIKVVVQ